jgi:hypothetical protein
MEPAPMTRGSETGASAHPFAPQICLYPGCERPVVPPHPLGGPPSSFCDLEEHNALTAHLERQRLERERDTETESRRSNDG